MSTAVLFDLDGTLWDSSQEVALSWSTALEPYGIRLSQADIRGVMGKTLDEIADLFLPDFSDERQAEILAACSEEELRYLAVHGAPVYPHLEEMLCDLSAEFALCIISNCQKGYIETFLEYSGLARYFTDTECAGGTGLSKGENIRLVMERNGFSGAVYVGDTPKDLDSARQAGVPFIHAAHGFGRVDPSLPAIHALDELPPLVRSMLPL